MLNNPILQKALDALQAKVKDRSDYDRIVEAGSQIIYNKEIFAQLSHGLKDAPDPINAVVEGIIGVLGIMFKKSRNTMPVPAMVMAGQALLIEALDTIEQVGMAKIDQQTLAKATSGYLNSLLPKFGLTPDKMGGALSQLQGTMRDPAKMAQIQGGK